MKKYSLYFLFLQTIFYFASCTTSHTKNTLHLPLNEDQQFPKPDKLNKPDEGEKFQFAINVLKEVSSLENGFFTQNCAQVQSHKLNLNEKYKINLENFSQLAKTAVEVCEAFDEKGAVNKIQRGIDNLKDAGLRYPLFNEPWIHTTLGDFYLAINDTKMAVKEKVLALNLMVLQQQDISNLNAQISSLDPSLAPLKFPTTGAPSAEQTTDQILPTVQRLLNNDTPDQALALIDSIPKEKQTEQIKRLRTESINSLVAKLRYKVRDLFVRAAPQTGDQRQTTLKQCIDILDGIIKNYPEYEDMASIKNNLKQINRELGL